MKVVKYTGRLIRVTFPIVIPVLRKYRAQLIILLLLSVILGFLPTIKSGIESNFLNEANRIIEPNGLDTTQKKNFDSIFNHEFARQTSNDGGFFDNLPNYFTNGNKVWNVILIYLFAILITFLFEYITQIFKTLIGKDIFVAIREQSFKKALNSNPSSLPKMFNLSGNISSSIQIGTGNITEVYNFIAGAFQYLFLLTTSLLVLFSKAWLFGILFILVLSLQVVISIKRAKRLKSDRNKLEKSRNNLIAQTEDIVSKKEIILAFDQGDKYSGKITLLSELYGGLSRRLDLRGFIYSSISKIINEVERLLIPLFALVFIIFFQRNSITNVGGIFFLITLYSRLSYPILALLSQFDSLKEKEAISNSLLDLLEIPNDKIVRAKKNASNLSNDAVIFKEVYFSYNGDKNILSDCSFTIPKNQTTIILGPSGSGKSTIAKIILGYWPVRNGEITLMDQDINSYTDKEIRLLSSYISQGDYIVEDTIRDNLNWAPAGESISDESMMQALHAVKLTKDLGDLSFLDKHAKDLSGGEQQRLSLARIILDNSPLLILDEPLTGVDVYTIKDIMPSFKKILSRQDHTVVLISHKLSFANSADNIILLNDEGSVIESGSLEDLFKNQNSVFSRLYNVAIKEFSFERVNT
jgi:ATP-binding cassette subfamily C protein